MKQELHASLIRERFTKVTNPEPDLIRAERGTNGTAFGIFYFDFSQSVASKDFDIVNYLERHLTADFYQHEGSLQWNYYLYFVLEEALFKQVWLDGKAAAIEADRTFARKYVKSEELFDAEIVAPLVEIVGSSKPPKDIAATWIQALNANGLGRISHPKAPYTQIVSDFLSGKGESEEKIVQTTNSVQATGRGHPLKSLDIKKFRVHPTVGERTFGKVNLIRGANGSGKTSLLEAIELGLCGGIRRQDGGKPPGARLYLTFEGRDQPEICPANSLAIYRERDLAWYGQYNRIGNRLWHNFSRFNFFDSDAAYRLSLATDAAEIEEAIGALFLGEQANAIEERMLACKERFEAEERQLSKQLSASRKQILRINSDLNDLKAVGDSSQTLSRETLTTGSNVGWKRLPKDLKLRETTILKESVDSLLSVLEEMVRQLEWISKVSPKRVKEEAGKLKKWARDVKATELLISSEKEALIESKDRLSRLESDASLLNRLKLYHLEPGAFTLGGINAAIQGSRATIKNLDRAIGLVKEIDITPFRKNSAKFEAFRTAQEVELSSLRKVVSQKRKRLASIKTHVDETNALVQQIRGLGHHFCELNPDSVECPLCGARYNEKLRVRLEMSGTESGIDLTLRDLTSELADDEGRLSTLQQLNAGLAKLGEAASIIIPSNKLASQSVESIVRALAELDSRRSSEQTKLETLISKEASLSVRGFTELELERLISQATRTLKLSESKVSSPSLIRSEAKSRNDAVLENGRILLEQEKREKDIQKRFRALKRESLGSDDVFDPSVELERRTALVDEALAVLARADKDLSIHQTDDISALKAQLTSFSSSLARLQKSLKQLEEKDLLEKRLSSSLEKASKEASGLNATHQRAQKAIDLIEGLLRDTNKHQYLEEVVNQHREKLATIFCGIHAPNEFRNVDLRGGLLLHRKSGDQAKISEVSTGQRAALALSIFLTMHSSVSAKAPWLLFDDPVAHIDDLNILSFLDVLRDLVLEGEGQVFFATASTRIADLFVKKFDFLGSTFKEFHLDRAAV